MVGSSQLATLSAISRVSLYSSDVVRCKAMLEFGTEARACFRHRADGAGSVAGYLFPASLTAPLDAKRSGATVAEGG